MFEKSPMKLAYLDCYSGVSGDMLLGALIACGADPGRIEADIHSLGLAELRLTIETVKRGALVGTRAVFEAPPQKAHRHFTHIAAMIEKAPLSARVKEQATAIFRRLGEVEAAIHGTTLEKVHFHEVGALDSIADIVGNCSALEQLGIDELHCSALNVGGGTIECDHGTLPVPAPATVELLKGLPIYSSGVQAELVTPTGAAIVATLGRGFGPLPAMKVIAVGYGAGMRDLREQPNMVRVTLGEAISGEAIGGEAIGGEAIGDETIRGATIGGASASGLLSQRLFQHLFQPGSDSLERLLLIEANLDDMNPQLFDYVAERAFAAGALDVYFTAVQMKKNRPGVLLSVLCRPEQVGAITTLIFLETTTLGVRSSEVLRRALEREMMEVATRYGPIPIKVARLNGKVVNFAPEFDDCRRISAERGVALQSVMLEASAAFLRTQS